MGKNYSVMTEPVIPVMFSNGCYQEIGIRDVFLQAHEITDLQCQSPLEEYAVFRLLVAITMDILRPERWVDRGNLLEKGRFNPQMVENYICQCEKDGPRFDLFDPVHPFMQTAYEAALDEKASKPVATLSVSLPSGNNHIFLDHRPESIPVMSPAEAFRALITLYVFCTAAAQGYPSGVNNTPPVYTRILGGTLYETLILNMLGTKEHPQIEDGYDAAPWRTETKVIPKEEAASISMMEGLTWMPRRACLLRDDDGLIRKVALQQGRNFRGNELWRDPHVAYYCSKKGEWISQKPQAGRALWRDISTLLADSVNEHYRPPLTVSQAGNIIDGDTANLQMRQIGVITNQASYVGWMEDRLSIPLCLLEDDLLAGIVREDTEETETVQSYLTQSLNNRYSHDKKHSTELAEQARLSFLAEMHDIIFGYSITDVFRFRENPDFESIKNHIIQFHRRMEEAILNTFRTVVQTSGNTAEDLQLQTEAQREVINRFRKYISERENRYE